MWIHTQSPHLICQYIDVFLSLYIGWLCFKEIKDIGKSDLSLLLYTYIWWRGYSGESQSKTRLLEKMKESKKDIEHKKTLMTIRSQTKCFFFASTMKKGRILYMQTQNISFLIVSFKEANKNKQSNYFECILLKLSSRFRLEINSFCIFPKHTNQ